MNPGDFTKELSGPVTGDGMRSSIKSDSFPLSNNCSDCRKIRSLQQTIDKLRYENKILKKNSKNVRIKRGNYDDKE